MERARFQPEIPESIPSSICYTHKLVPSPVALHHHEKRVRHEQLNRSENSSLARSMKKKEKREKQLLLLRILPPSPLPETLLKPSFSARSAISTASQSVRLRYLCPMYGRSTAGSRRIKVRTPKLRYMPRFRSAGTSITSSCTKHNLGGYDTVLQMTLPVLQKCQAKHKDAGRELLLHRQGNLRIISQVCSAGVASTPASPRLNPIAISGEMTPLQLERDEEDFLGDQNVDHSPIEPEGENNQRHNTTELGCKRHTDGWQ